MPGMWVTHQLYLLVWTSADHIFLSIYEYIYVINLHWSLFLQLDDGPDLTQTLIIFSPHTTDHRQTAHLHIKVSYHPAQTTGFTDLIGQLVRILMFRNHNTDMRYAITDNRKPITLKISERPWYTRERH